MVSGTIIVVKVTMGLLGLGFAGLVVGVVCIQTGRIYRIEWIFLEIDNKISHFYGALGIDLGRLFEGGSCLYVAEFRVGGVVGFGLVRWGVRIFVVVLLSRK